MKAILRCGAGLLGLLLASSVSFGYELVSPVFKQPYPQAPDLFNSTGYYLIDGWGRLTGPYYNLRPPCQPFNGMLPGKTGQALMAGQLSHKLLLSKEGLAIGVVPLVGQRTSNGTPEKGALPGAGLPELGGPPGAYMFAGAPGPMSAPNANLQMPYGQMPYPMPYPNMPYGQMPNPNMQAPIPYPMPNPNVQVPYTQMPYPYGAMPYRAMPASMPYSMQAPSGAMPYPMPYGAAPMPYPMPMQPRTPMTYYPMSNGNYARYYDPRTGISQAQNLAPGQQPFMPIPGFGVPGSSIQPSMPMAPPPGMPMAPMPPGMGMGGQNGFQNFGPMQQADPLGQLYRLEQLQRMQPPMGQMERMQMPRMDYTPPSAPKVGGGAYPTHPFVRSPRDFFMWGENMEDEERMRKRPFPVP